MRVNDSPSESGWLRWRGTKPGAATHTSIVQAILRFPLLVSKAGDRISGTILNRPWPLLALVLAVIAGVAIAISTPDLAGTALVVTLAAALGLQTVRAGRAERQQKYLEADLRASKARIGDLGARLQSAQEEERARIARELHDDLSQQLVVLQFELRHVGNARSLRRIEEIGQSVHDLANSLYPARLRTLGLSGALQLMTSEYERTPMFVSMTQGIAPPNLPASLTLCLYRVAQEALQNAAKHSRARHVLVDLQCKGAELRLTIGDDGVGFLPDTTVGNGLGLISIRDRVEAAGGRVKIHSAPGRGTRLEVSVPVS